MCNRNTVNEEIWGIWEERIRYKGLDFVGVSKVLVKSGLLDVSYFPN